MNITKEIIFADRVLSKGFSCRGRLKPITDAYIEAQKRKKIIEIGPPKAPKDNTRPLIFFTSGKDSVSLALRLKHLDPILVYVDGINKSECYYEKRAAINFSKRMNFDLKIYKLPLQVKRNRANHNIGLRDLIITTSAFGLAKSLNIDQFWFGITHKYQPPELWCETREAHEKLRECSKVYYQERFFSEFNVTELDCIKDCIDNDVLDITSSCYTQINFREHRNALLKNRFPLDSFYHGCGSCIKCIRINGGIIFFKGSSDGFKKYWLEKSKKFENDSTIKQLRSDILECK